MGLVGIGFFVGYKSEKLSVHDLNSTSIAQSITLKGVGF